MAKDGAGTRERLLDAAEAAVIRQGFAATSVDEIIRGADVSRGTFFYHFPTKDVLGRELMRRYAEADVETAEAFMARAESLTPDPLHQVLVFVGLYIEMLEGSLKPPEGCLIASYVYESGLFDAETNGLMAANLEHWRGLVGGKLDEAMDRHRPLVEVTGGELAELLYGIIEGAYVVARIEGDGSVLAGHLRHFRTHLELLFDVRGSRVGGEAPVVPAEP